MDGSMCILRRYACTYLPYVAAHIFYQVEETQKHAEKAEAEVAVEDDAGQVWSIYWKLG